MTGNELIARIPEMLRRAFTLLRTAPAGPVLVEVPLDVGNDELPGGDGAGELHGYRPVAARRSVADAADVRELVAGFLAADEWVINAGHGVLGAQATPELTELRATPVFTTLSGKSAFPEDHPLSLGTGARTATLPVSTFL